MGVEDLRALLLREFRGFESLEVVCGCRGLLGKPLVTSVALRDKAINSGDVGPAIDAFLENCDEVLGCWSGGCFD